MQQEKKKKNHNTPRDRGLPPRDRFTDGGERSGVGKGVRDLDHHPRQGEAQAYRTLASLQEQVDGSSLWKHQGGAKLRTSGVSAGAPWPAAPAHRLWLFCPGTTVPCGSLTGRSGQGPGSKGCKPSRTGAYTLPESSKPA